MSSVNRQDLQTVWLFDFALESESGDPVELALADELMDKIVEWAEDHNLQVGGGYRPARADELEPPSVVEGKKSDSAQVRPLHVSALKSE